MILQNNFKIVAFVHFDPKTKKIEFTLKQQILLLSLTIQSRVMTAGGFYQMVELISEMIILK